ncbi:MAG TPA: response regulator [Polyangiaceae bacterium]|jgi:CheY-like chemotaxis protein
MAGSSSGLVSKASGVTVLFVDDYVDTRLAYASEAEACGFIPQLAGDGHEALAHVRLDPPTIVVTEVMLRGLDGFELTRRIRAMPRPIPVVLLTGIILPDLAASARRAGCAALLTKPCPFEIIERTIRRLVGERLGHARQA